MRSWVHGSMGRWGDGTILRSWETIRGHQGPSGATHGPGQLALGKSLKILLYDSSTIQGRNSCNNEYHFKLLMLIYLHQIDTRVLLDKICVNKYKNNLIFFSLHLTINTGLILTPVRYKKPKSNFFGKRSSCTQCTPKSTPTPKMSQFQAN